MNFEILLSPAALGLAFNAAFVGVICLLRYLDKKGKL